MFMSIIGIVNTSTRAFLGWLSDRPWADAIHIHCIVLVIAGSATMFAPKYSDYTVITTYYAIFGLSFGEWFRLRYCM